MLYQLYGFFHKSTKRLLRRSSTAGDAVKFAYVYQDENLPLILNAANENLSLNDKEYKGNITIKDSTQLFMGENAVIGGTNLPLTKWTNLGSCESPRDAWCSMLHNTAITYGWRNAGFHLTGFLLEKQNWVLSSWIWTSAAICRCFLTIGETDNACKIADAFLREQLPDGGWIVRYDFGAKETIPMVAPNDSAYIANNALLEMYRTTGEWGKTGINCFVLITGYFMCEFQITARKFAKLLGEVMFYNIVIYLLFLMTGYEPFSLKTLLLSIVPITSVNTNFTACYLIFFLAIPFLNILIHNITQKQHFLLMILCGFTYIFFGTMRRVTMNYVSWYAVLYIIASYIRIYPKPMYDNVNVWGWVTLLCMAISMISVVMSAWLGMKLNRQMAYCFVSDSNTLLAVIVGIASFLFFKNIEIKYSRLINTVAASTFGVLCIHANSDTMRRWLWKDIFSNVVMYNSQYLILYSMGSVVVVFLVCTVIDWIRITLLEKTFLLWFDEKAEKAIAHFRDSGKFQLL